MNTKDKREREREVVRKAAVLLGSRTSERKAASSRANGKLAPRIYAPCTNWRHVWHHRSGKCRFCGKSPEELRLPTTEELRLPKQGAAP